MKKRKIVISLLILLIIFLLIKTFLFRETLYIKDFDSVSKDYTLIKDMLFKYYDRENNSEMLILVIDDKTYELKENDTGKEVNMSEEEKESLIKICETSYKGHYDFLWVTDYYIIFWQDETKMYGVIYTKDYKKSKKEIKSWYGDGIQFRKIKKGWYEIGHFGI